MYVCASGVGLVSDSLIALGGLKYLVTLYTEVNTVVKSIITYLYRNVNIIVGLNCAYFNWEESSSTTLLSSLA